MPYLLCYTRKGPDSLSELNDSVHLAVSRDGKAFTPLRHNTGILFAEADFEDGGLPGKAKTLTEPWAFRWKEGGIGVIAVRKNKYNIPDNKFTGCVVIYRTEDLKSFRFTGFLKLGSREIRKPACIYNEETDIYELQWEEDGIPYSAKSKDLLEIGSVQRAASLNRRCEEYNIDGAISSNVLEITEQEAFCLETLHLTPVNTKVTVENMEFETVNELTTDRLPPAQCSYSDGSKHRMRVQWNENDIRRIKEAGPGVYTVHGKIDQTIYPLPFTRKTGDPFITLYNGRYFMTWSGNREVTIRGADTLNGLHDAEDKTLYSLPDSLPDAGNMWAPELHVIEGIPYLFTTVGEQGKWYTVRSCVMKCNGNPENPADWTEPVFCIKADGTPLNEEGISLDMTYFCIDGTHYVIWSNRVLDKDNYETNEFGTNGCAVLCIATIDPGKPWQLTSSPVEISRPYYGWERIENEINEGAYLLEHGEDLFLTYSGSSVGVLYCVGILKAKRGNDLLDPDSWEKLQYPVLTKESVAGQYGPGHNNFVKSPDGSGDDLMVFHSKEYPADDPEDVAYLKNPRNAAIRRVHWNRWGYPVLDMLPEQELLPEFRNVSCQIMIKQ